ncbi:MAG: hypothetical protein HRT90_09465 [Candidatus Margulisbacteria bacterium]|nr:hypothetical protein [Candidatus Margulisiibacteriota bacterium]
MKNVIFYGLYNGEGEKEKKYVKIPEMVTIWVHHDLMAIFETIKKAPIDYIIFLNPVASVEEEDMKTSIIDISQQLHNCQPELILSY